MRTVLFSRQSPVWQHICWLLSCWSLQEPHALYRVTLAVSHKTKEMATKDSFRGKMCLLTGFFFFFFPLPFVQVYVANAVTH